MKVFTGGVKYIWKIIQPSILGVCLIGSLKAQEPHNLQRALQSLNRDAALASATWGFCAIDVQNGAMIAGFDEQKSMVTASVMKAVTTATALGVLGADFRFDTFLEYEGSISSDGTLRGNVYISGTGDPTLGSDRFPDQPDINGMFALWAEKIRRKGIKRIEGKIIADASIFDSQLTPGNWSWEDMGNYYGAGVSGLNINENLYRLDFSSGQATGSNTKILRTVPFMDQLVFVNEVKTGAVGSGDNAYIYGSPYTQIRYVRGTIPGGRSTFSIKGSISDPATFVARRMYQVLREYGITVVQGYDTQLDRISESRLRQRTNIYTHHSPLLKDIVEATNMKSINLYAEALLKRISAEKRIPGTTKMGIRVVKEYWDQMNVETSGMLIRDGSGLSSNNVISPYQLAQILRKAYQTPYGQDFYQSLPVAGRSGSLKNMLRGTRAEGRLRAKSGYISAVRAYAGYVVTARNRLVSFAMIANNYTCSSGQMRRKFEKLMVELAEMD